MATTPNAPQFSELRTALDVVQRGFQAIQKNQSSGSVAIPDNVTEGIEGFPRVMQWLQKQEKQYSSMIGGEQARGAGK